MDDEAAVPFPAEADPRPLPRLVKPLAWIMAGVTSVLLFGIIDLSTLPGWANPAYQWPVPLEVSWGSFFTFVLAGSYVWIALSPRDPWPATVQLGVAAAALFLSTIVGLDARPLPIAALVAGSATLFALLTRKVSDALPRLWSLSWPYLFLAVAGAPMWLIYALRALDMSRQGKQGDDTWGIEHWPVQGALGLTLGLCAVIMAFWTPGRALLRLSTSVSATFIGAAMLAYPHREGAMEGPMWGVAMVIWGTLLALPLPGSRKATARTAVGA